MRLGRLREWRESAGLTQKELAAKAQVSEFTVAGTEGGGDTRPNTARKLAEAMGLKVADLQESPPVALGKDSPPVVGAHGAMREMDVSKQRRAVEQASETVVVIRYSDEEIDPSEAFAEAARIWPEVRQDYEGVLSSEPPHKLTLSDDGECVQIVVEPASESDCT